jgi:GTP-binding protein
MDVEELKDSPELPIYCSKSTEFKDTYMVEGPRVERMLGYTNLEDEKGFLFFQNFMKKNGILDELIGLGMKEGDTVNVYGHEFTYYE